MVRHRLIAGAVTIRSRELGDGLRQAMEGAGLTGKQAAKTLSWSPSFVSMLLSGKRGTSLDYTINLE